MPTGQAYMLPLQLSARQVLQTVLLCASCITQVHKSTHGSVVKMGTRVSLQIEGTRGWTSE